ncbi:hypothetical protein K432DRAFT_384843 [Lepidopterella palustris CBS 459.81]|uniref:Cytochrome P450 n=1 Tax=Lepidopterella palustris CBS 459.81 TaxID=1314670 RepID=A0A8E2E4J5_9PEZI|nr:hypothetical protein K432DRAFT_384843 [Lepidopterella palustris CBS 459.81]
MSALFQPYKSRNPSKNELETLAGDSRLIILAGSDTTSSTLVHFFHLLALHPNHARLIRAEMVPLINASREIPHCDLQNLDHFMLPYWT